MLEAEAHRPVVFPQAADAKGLRGAVGAVRLEGQLADDVCGGSQEQAQSACLRVRDEVKEFVRDHHGVTVAAIFLGGGLGQAFELAALGRHEANCAVAQYLARDFFEPGLVFGVEVRIGLVGAGALHRPEFLGGHVGFRARPVFIDLAVDDVALVANPAGQLPGYRG